MSHAIDDLLHEHQAILFALKILANMTKRLEKGQEVDPGDLSAFVDFLKEFADQCHHGKEEGFLFPALVRTGHSDAEAEVDLLLGDHTTGRLRVAEMAAAIKPTVNPGAFVLAARSYADLLRAHIEKENTVLFPMAEDTLSAGQLETLYKQFEEHESMVIGEGRHEALHAVLNALKAKYATD